MHEFCNSKRRLVLVQFVLALLYMVFHKKGPLFVFLIIHSNDDQFTQNFSQL